MGRGGSASAARVYTLKVDGERALPVFKGAEAAEDHLMLAGLGDGYEVFGGPAGDLYELIRERIAPHVGYVAVSPPVALRGAPPPAVELVPIERFLESLKGA